MRKILFLLVVSALAACATKYQAQGFAGGFTETQLDTNVFRVSFKGNGYTGADRAEEMALLRSAELTLKSGFTHFAIAGTRSQTDFSSFTTPKQATTTGTVSSYGSTSYLNTQTSYTGGQTFTAAKPSTTNTIVCFNGKPNIEAFVYDAQFIYNSLSKKYELPSAVK